MPALAGHIRQLWHGKASLVLLVAVLVVGATLRWRGLDWDQGHLFHPDERFILMTTAGLALPLPPDWSLLLSPNSPLNPHSFAYGSLPFYLLSLAGHLIARLGTLSESLATLRVYADFEHLRLLGRSIAGLFDLGSILLVFLIGRRLYDDRAGLLAAAFVSVSVINIQYAHFYASDSMLTFFVLLAVLFALRLLRQLTWQAASLAGLAIGLAIGSKFSAMPLLAVAGTAYLIRLFATEPGIGKNERPLRFAAPSGSQLHRVVGAGLLTLLVASVVFVIVEPYALIDFGTFVKNIREQNDMVRGIADLPYTRQYANTPAYWYFVQNLIVWGLGLPLGIVIVLSAIGTTAKTMLRPTAAGLVMLSWMLPYFAITGDFHSKFLRYLLPLVPFVAISAAQGLLELMDWLGSKQRAALVAAPRFTPAPVPAAAASSPPEFADEQVLPNEQGANVALPPGYEVRSALAMATQPPVPPVGRRLLSTARIAVGAAVFLALSGGLAYAVAFSNIYSDKHTAVRASEWIYQNVPRGSRLMVPTHWEEGLPVPRRIDGQTYDSGSMGYRMLTVESYEADNVEKLNQLVQATAQADYVLFFSNRIYGTIPRLPKHYPLTSEYYRLLFGERLGFRLEADFVQQPSLAGVTLVEDTLSDPGLPAPAKLADYLPSSITVNLGKADESFSVYDHPKVLIFKKYESLSAEQLRALLAPALTPPQAPPAVVDAPKSLLLSDAQREAVTAGGTFGDLFDREDFANRLPIPVWLVMVELVGLLGAPFAFEIFRHLPDRGHLLGKVLAILLLSWLHWIIVSLGLLQNTRAAVGIALAVLVLGSLAVGWWRRRDLLSHWRERKKLIVLGEAVFLAAFALFLIIRLANPDLWHPARGGEKPMDLAYLMAAIRSTTFPPYDPWFANGYLNYYYYGQIVVATLIKLSGIIPTTAYNLVVPTLFALTAGGVFSVTVGVLASPGHRSRRMLLAALAALAFAVLFGNLGGATQLFGQISALGAAPLRSSLPGVQGVATFVAGMWALAVEGKALAISTDWYWASTRVLEGTINEFPFFTFLYADLHAHMIAMPFTVLAIGLAVDAVKARLSRHSLPVASDAEGLAGQVSGANAAVRWPSHVVRVVVAGLVIGALAPINSWDFPTYLGLYALTLLAAWYLRKGDSAGWLSLAGVIAEVLAVALLAYLLYWPFHSSFQQWYLGVDPVKDKSDVAGYLKIHGLFLYAIGSFLAAETYRRFRRNGFLRTVSFWLNWWQFLPRALTLRKKLLKRHDVRDELTGYGVAALVAAILLLHFAGATLLALLLGLLVWTAALALRRDTAPERLFVLLLIGTGLVLSAVVELVALKGDIGRMNTVFKFYLQVWMLWSVASACSIYYVAREIFRHNWRHRGVWTASLATLVLAALIYPLIATRARAADRYDRSVPMTLDGTAYMATATFREENPATKQSSEIQLGKDLPAMRWLQDNVEGTPVILEGWAPLYHWGARYSIYTGLPTVIGWDWHQKQQRWGYQSEVERRLSDVRGMYGDASVELATALLDRYRVRYIIVGDLERAIYSAQGLAKFDAMVGRTLDVVYDDNGVKIYQRR